MESAHPRFIHLSFTGCEIFLENHHNILHIKAWPAGFLRQSFENKTLALNMFAVPVQIITRYESMYE